MKNKLSIGSSCDALIGEEVAHPGADIFIVMIDGHGVGRFCLRLRLCAGGEERSDDFLAKDQ
jgi:hypothetical protein